MEDKSWNPFLARIVTPPDALEAFPGARRARSKTPVPGGGLRRRWKDEDGMIYEWDYQHGTVEVYDRNGRHRGEYDPVTGRRLKPGGPRSVEP